MGRPIRIQFPGACYFIVLQGNNRQHIFLSNQDRRFFLNLLRGHKERCGLKIYAFCLMDDQVQLLLETGQQPLARVMQAFNTAYTKYFNKQHNMVGHVFRGRYKAWLVDKANYLVEMSYHVHLEPVRAGLKEKPWRYLWSSCAAYVEAVEREPLVDSEPVLRALGKGRLKQSVEYLKAIKDKTKAGAKGSFPSFKGCIGSPEFAASMSPSSLLPVWGPSSQEKVQKILEEFISQGVDRDKLFGRSQWRSISNLRKQAVYRIWKEARLGVSELGRIFHRTPSAISQMIHSLEAENPSLAKEKVNI